MNRPDSFRATRHAPSTEGEAGLPREEGAGLGSGFEGDQGRTLRIRGQVQGVGFRPHVYRLATGLNLKGSVRNDTDGVHIALYGPAEQLGKFESSLVANPPPMAIIDSIEAADFTPARVPDDFTIAASSGGSINVEVTPDAAVCGDCLKELFDTQGRRYRYAFINCTHCGPRYSITRSLPYDRPNTTMAAFVQCPACMSEYVDPNDRRFHAQPNACAECGPRLEFRQKNGDLVAGVDPITHALSCLRDGQILAVKGIGGFHLVCDARNEGAVKRLRERKCRPEKPFALMALNCQSVESLADVPETSVPLFESQTAPILLLKAKPGQIPSGVAPGLDTLGFMLPYSPLHYLLFHEAAGRPEGTAWLDDLQDLVLVVTSANPRGEPLVIGNAEALERLPELVDGYVLHNRDILIRCDDSVYQGAANPPFIIRRGRGLAPQVLKLGRSGPSVLATGGFFKNTVCVTKGDKAYVSQYLGDLDNATARRAFADSIDHLCSLFDIRPEWVAVDLHPDIYSTRFGQEYGLTNGLPVLGVQHHHAHLAAALAETGSSDTCLGVALDGVGYGIDGQPWGGELLKFSPGYFQRLGHLSTLVLPGSDQAAREPWRVAAGVLWGANLGSDVEARFSQYPAARFISRLLDQGTNSPRTSSCGRLFDAAAALLGVCERLTYEAEAAMRLESLALEYGPIEGSVDGFQIDDGNLNLVPVLLYLHRQRTKLPNSHLAALFHGTLIDGLAAWVIRAAAAQGLNQVVLSGGCFLNRVLRDGLTARLEASNLRVILPSRLPANDGGLSLGQAWVCINSVAS